MSDEEYYGPMTRNGRASFDEVLREQLTKTPWWMVSVGFHAVIFMIGYFVMAEVVQIREPLEVVTKLADEPEEFDDEPEPEVEDPSPIDAEPTEIPSPDIADEVKEPDTDSSEEDVADGDPDMQSTVDMDARFTNTSLGVGANAGGKWGLGGDGGKEWAGRLGGPKGRKRPHDREVSRGLVWLVKHQSSNGSWHCSNFAHQCEGNVCDGAGSHAEYTPGMTGLSLLAFLGAGHTHKHGRYRNVVRRGVKYLRSIQTPDGCVGPKNMDGHYIYNHAIATMALAEAYGMTQSDALKRPAQQAVDFLISAQNPYLGWRYGIRPGDNDTSITGWAVLALKSARLAELNVPDDAFLGAKQWVEKVTDDSFFKTGYTQKGDNGARLPDAQRYEPSEAMTAAGLCIRVFTGAKASDPAVRGGATLLRNQPPRWDPESSNDYYYWYYGTLAMFQIGGEDWKVWERGMKQAIVKTQRRSGCEEGSWDPTSAWGGAGGRVYATAINVLSLEIYYRYSKVLGGGR